MGGLNPAASIVENSYADGRFILNLFVRICFTDQSWHSTCSLADPIDDNSIDDNFSVELEQTVYALDWLC